MTAVNGSLTSSSVSLKSNGVHSRNGSIKGDIRVSDAVSVGSGEQPSNGAVPGDAEGVTPGSVPSSQGGSPSKNSLSPASSTPHSGQSSPNKHSGTSPEKHSGTSPGPSPGSDHPDQAYTTVAVDILPEPPQPKGSDDSGISNDSKLPPPVVNREDDSPDTRQVGAKINNR